MKRAVLFLLSGLTLASPAFPEGPSLLILSKGDHTLAIVDPATQKVLAKAPVGQDPHEVIASTDGKYAYVSIYGGGAYNTIDVIDLVNRKTLSPIDLGPLRGPHGLVYVGAKLWFTAEAAKAIGRYDPAKNAVDLIVGTGQNRTHMLWVTDDMKQIYTTNIASGTVTIIEKSARSAPPPPPGAGPGGPPPRRGPMGPPGGDWDETIIPVGKGDEGFDVSPDRKELWTANAGDGTVSIINLAAKKVTATIDADVAGANRLKFTPDGRYVLITSLGNKGLTILDANTRQQVKRIDLGGAAAGIQVQPDGARAYIACTGGNYVGVLDLKTLTLVSRIDAGPGPDGMAWTTIP